MTKFKKHLFRFACLMLLGTGALILWIWSLYPGHVYTATELKRVEQARVQMLSSSTADHPAQMLPDIPNCRVRDVSFWKELKENPDGFSGVVWAAVEFALVTEIGIAALLEPLWRWLRRRRLAACV